MAEPKPPSASVEGKAEVEWSPHAGAGTGAPTKAGERLLEPEEIDGLLQGGRNGAQTGVEARIKNATVTYERLPMLEVVFDRLIGATDAASGRARSALEGLKQAAGETGERLTGDIDKAQRLLDDLRFLCERSERLADGLAERIESSRMPPASGRAEAPAPDRPPAADLERTLRTLR